jgi:hypothetical protein
MAKRVARYLERAKYLHGDAELEYLDMVPEEDDVHYGIVGASISYRMPFVLKTRLDVPQSLSACKCGDAIAGDLCVLPHSD